MERDYKNPLFSINRYDYEGDIVEEGLFLVLGDCIRLKFKNPDELKTFGEAIVSMATSEEVQENWNQ